MRLNILQIGDERLTKPSVIVENFADKKLQKLIDDMIETCEADKKHTAGLAAPQVGENIRLTVIRRIDKEEWQETKEGVSNKSKSGRKPTKTIDSKDLWEAIINPEIIAIDEEHDTMVWEACLSIGKGEKQVWGPVYRPATIEIKYQDRQGKEQKLKAEGFFSHVIQHEIDHLDGVLFISRVTNPEANLWLNRDLDKYLKEYDKFPEIIQ